MSTGARHLRYAGTRRSWDRLRAWTARRPPHAPSPAAQPSLLVVDDEACIRAFLVELLEDEGYTASAVANGQAALDYLHTHPAPCCIILDLYMPVMDGW